MRWGTSAARRTTSRIEGRDSPLERTTRKEAEMSNPTRRQVLKQSSLALAGALALPRAGAFALTQEPAPPLPPSRMRFGLVTYLWGADLDLPTLIEVGEKSGVLGLELRSTHRHGVEPGLDAQQRSEIKKRFDDSPVTFVGPGSDERFDTPDPEALARAIEATRRFVKLSADLGGSGVKVKPDSFHKGVPREKTIEQIGRSLNALGPFAAEHGQEIRLEVHGQCAELPTIEKIMQVADHPAVVVCWNCNGEDLAGEGLESNFALVKDRLGDTVHVRALDRGSYPYDRLMELLRGIEYGGWVLLEARGEIPEDRAAGLAAQRRLFEELVSD